MNRREFLKAAALSSMIFMPGVKGWAFGESTAEPNANTKKLIVILLRGGIDGLNVVVPSCDPNYYALRPTVAF